MATSPPVTVEVCVRVRPSIPSIDNKAAKAVPTSLRDTNAPATVSANRATRQVSCVNAPSIYNKSAGSTKRTFQFHQVFAEDDSTVEIFERCYKELVIGALDGHSVCIFAYGGTGSGKTYTLAGDGVNPTLPHNCDTWVSFDSLNSSLVSQDTAGFMSLSVAAVFEKITQEEQGRDHTVNFSCFEIYDDKLFDLLADRTPVRVMTKEDKATKRKTVHFTGLSQTTVRDPTTVMGLLARAMEGKTMGKNYQHERSSRSHTVMRLEIGVQDKHDPELRHATTIMVVDLAGAEAAHRNASDLMGFREGTGINMSLMHLKSCVSALAKNKGVGQVSGSLFRQSNLTRLLEPCLTEGFKVGMILNLAPICSDMRIALDTLEFGEQAREVTLKQNPTRLFKSEAEFTRLQEANEALKSDLDRMQHEVRELRRDRIEHIPRLTPHEVQVLEDAFRKLDVDKSGKVSFKEFSSVLKRDGELCLIMTRGIISDDGQDHLTLKEIARLWEVIDQDMSATLTVEEIKAVWQPGEMRGMRKQLHEAQQEIARLQRELTLKESLELEFRQEVKDLQAELAEARKCKTDCEQVKKNLHKELMLAQKEAVKYKQELSESKQGTKQADDFAHRYKNDLDALRKELLEKEKQLHARVSQSKEAEDKVKQSMEKALGELRQELDHADQRANQATDKAKQDREDLKQARARLKASEEDSEKRVGDLMRQLEQAHARNQQSPRSSKSEAELKIKQLEAELAKLRKQPAPDSAPPAADMTDLEEVQRRARDELEAAHAEEVAALNRELEASRAAQNGTATPLTLKAWEERLEQLLKEAEQEAQAAAESAGRVEGWLYKKGGGTSVTGRRNWTRRYFILHGPLLKYFDDAPKHVIEDLAELPSPPGRESSPGKKRPEYTPIYTGDLQRCEGGSSPLSWLRNSKGREILQVAFHDKTLQLSYADSTHPREGKAQLQKWHDEIEAHYHFYATDPAETASKPTMRLREKLKGLDWKEEVQASLVLELETLRAQVAQLEQQKRELEDVTDASGADRALVSEELEVIHGVVDQLKEENARLLSLVEASEENRMALEEANQELEKAARAHAEEGHEATEHLLEHKLELRQQLEQSQAALAAAKEAALEEAAELRVKMQIEIDERDQNILALRQSVAAADNEHKETWTELQKLQATLEEKETLTLTLTPNWLQAALEEKEREMTALQAETTRRTQQLGLELSDDQARITALTTELSEVETAQKERITALTLERDSALDAIDEMNQFIRSQGETITSKKHECESLESECRQLRASLEEATAHLETTRQEKVDAMALLRMVRQEITEKEENQRESDSLREAAERAIEDMNAFVRRQTQEIASEKQAHKQSDEMREAALAAIEEMNAKVMQQAAAIEQEKEAHQEP